LESSNECLIDYFTKSVKYIGPVRCHTSFYSSSKAFDAKDVGVEGEYVAYVIDKFRNEVIDYYPPPEDNDTFYRPEQEPLKVKFIDALINWLKYLDLADDIKAEEILGGGYKLKVKLPSDKKHRDITHVGFGVSQVLPIVVTCLLAKPGSTLIFESPEEQLHTRAQSRLADFFIYTARLDKQCIIETHSECLLNELRIRIAENLLNRDDYTSNRIKIYNLSIKNSCTEPTEIKINKYADWSVWPDRFFDTLRNHSASLFDIIDSHHDDTTDDNEDEAGDD
jgi:predicted ATPase